MKAAQKLGCLERALRRRITETPFSEGVLRGIEHKGVTGWLC